MSDPGRNLEIERRFLCRIEPGVLERAEARQEMRQGYLTEDEPSVRVRVVEGRWTLTVKRGTGRVRQEVEAPLPQEAGEALLEMAGRVQLEKTRHVLGRWVVDRYGGPLEGILIAECELWRADEPLPPPPAGLELVREVTDRLTAHDLARLRAPEARRLVQSLLEGA